jgi:hypothetical protein
MKGIHFICLFLCLTAFAPCPGQAQTEKVLHNFCGLESGHDGTHGGTVWALLFERTEGSS